MQCQVVDQIDSETMEQRLKKTKEIQQLAQKRREKYRRQEEWKKAHQFLMEDIARFKK